MQFKRHCQLFSLAPTYNVEATACAVLFLAYLAGVQGSLTGLYQTIEARLALYKPLASLQGRLDLVLAQAAPLDPLASHLAAGPMVSPSTCLVSVAYRSQSYVFFVGTSASSKCAVKRHLSLSCHNLLSVPSSSVRQLEGCGGGPIHNQRKPVIAAE